MNTYYFLLGNSATLAAAEIRHVLTSQKVAFQPSPLLHNFLPITSELPLDTQRLITHLGGTIKIQKEVGIISEITPDSVANFIDTSVKDFSVSIVGESKESLEVLHSKIKDLLLTRQQRVRYVLPKDKTLSAVVIKKQNVQEYVLIQKENGWQVTETVAVQDVDEWSRRDYGRPHADAKLGMLPPKVSRMMVNLALIGEKSRVLYDPFCGMGTIVGEALLAGCTVYASDYSKDVLDKASKNIAWLRETYKLPDTQECTFIVADATHADLHIPPHSVDAIVTEPYMGSPFELKKGQLTQRGKLVSEQTVLDTLKGLEKLYRGALKSWKLILKSGGAVVLIIPSISFNGKEYFVKNIIDKCENLGYTLSEGPYSYRRPQAIINRNIYHLKTFSS